MSIKGAPWAPVNGESSLEVPTSIETSKVSQQEQDGEERHEEEKQVWRKESKQGGKENE